MLKIPAPRRCLVGVFNVVGLSNVFQTIDGIPTPEMEKEKPKPTALDDAFQETLGFLQWARLIFPTLYHHYPFEKNRLAPYEDHLKKIEALQMMSALKVQAFSDALIPYAWLPEDDFHLTALSAIYRMFCAGGSLLVLSMASGRAVRGGIDAESAVEWTDGEIYGRALNEALAGEMRLADYPRIIVGASLRAYLKSITQIMGRSVLLDQAKGVAKQCLDLVIEDLDGQHMLHYLSPAFKPAMLTDDSFTQARAFIDHQLSIWRAAGQARLVHKYQSMDLYWKRYAAQRT